MSPTLADTLVHPIRHGARVVLPVEDAGQGRLWEE
jgi:hypothetical protein